MLRALLGGIALLLLAGCSQVYSDAQKVVYQPLVRAADSNNTHRYTTRLNCWKLGEEEATMWARKATQVENDDPYLASQYRLNAAKAFDASYSRLITLRMIDEVTRRAKDKDEPNEIGESFQSLDCLKGYEAPMPLPELPQANLGG